MNTDSMCPDDPPEDELLRLWQSASAGGQKDAAETIATIRKKTRAFDRVIFWRDVREIGTAAMMVVVFTYVAYMSRPRPLLSAGFVLGGASCLFIVGWLWRSRRAGPKPVPEESVSAYGGALLARYDRQIALLRSVKYWYLLPLYVSELTIYAGVLTTVPAGALARARAQRPGLWLAAMAFLVAMPILLTAFTGFAWWLNEGYSAKKLAAERRSLAAMLPSDEQE